MPKRLVNQKFVFENFSALPPFASFLPGVCGIQGVPLWAFYVNRGQCIASFGVEDKDHAIMEFSPAVVAYEDTARKGFRTFVKAGGQCFEPFFQPGAVVTGKMRVNTNSITIEEFRNDSQLRFCVTYFLMPEENLGALVRIVTGKNLAAYPREIEVLDGMARIIPYGISNSEFKEMANLFKSFAAVNGLEKGIPFFATRSSLEDSAEVSATKGGYFYCTAMDGAVIAPICDPCLVFGQDTGLTVPDPFYKLGSKTLSESPQYCDNKIPCAFTPISFTLQAGAKKEFHTLIGYAPDESLVWAHKEQFVNKEWISQKQKRSQEITQGLTYEADTHTALPMFDAYIGQCYLDNLLRGGWPYVLAHADNKKVLHLYSRKHGDLERDYNFFQTEAGFYSQGNGNFRDVCQNRRSEILFHPEIGDFDVLTFANLLQIDGYNPLELRPSLFRLPKEAQEDFRKICIRAFSAGDNCGRLTDTLKKGATPGDICRIITDNSLTLDIPLSDFIEETLLVCVQEQQAAFKEGYWSDHWTYVPDLIRSYLQIFPENKNSLFFGKSDIRFYDSPALVLPRSQKYCIQNGRVRQFGSCIADLEKKWDQGETRWLKNEKGEIARTSLFGKLYHLAVIKCATLDPLQMGVEMEGGKPGWNDAFNGLPGLLGSSTSETVELLGLVKDLQIYLHGAPEKLDLPGQIAALGESLDNLIEERLLGNITSHYFWDKSSALREDLRADTRFALSSAIEALPVPHIALQLRNMEKFLEQGLSRAASYAPIIPTYFTYNAVEFEPVVDGNTKAVCTPYGLPSVNVNRFEAKALPTFLETPAKLIRYLPVEHARNLYQKIRSSELYDVKLQMYRTSVSIESLSIEHGRIRSFSPGWFERESIFMHMEYKYLLGLFDAGLYDVFFEEMPHLLVPFFDPAVYGRSILENSSFIASSVNPDPSVHGRGYIARLSGSTAEVISMWQRMFIGNVLFAYHRGGLRFCFQPKLPGGMFTDAGLVSFQLFGCEVRYCNPLRKNTFGENAAHITQIRIDGIVVSSDCYLTSQYADKFRRRKLKLIEVIFE